MHIHCLSLGCGTFRVNLLTELPISSSYAHMNQ
ncbi:unnamed protein product, partial [marine sediment metagenome]